MNVLRMIASDRFIWLLSGAVLLAVLLPISGAAVPIAHFISSSGIFLIFLLHGIKLERREVISGLRNIRLQSAIFGFVFGVMLVTGFITSKVMENFLPDDLALGFLFLGVLPSTVQSATSYCSIARGNVAASIVASALLNLTGIFISPLLFTFLASASGVTITSDAILRVLVILLLPFILGQVIQRWLRPIAVAKKSLIGWMDRIAISIAVYVSFSGAVVAGAWFKISGLQLFILATGLCVVLAIGFIGAWRLGAFLHLPRPDRKTLLFSGAQKSIAIGAPLAVIIFSQDRAGIVLLPLLLYHLTQLIISAPLALHLARDS